MNGAVDAFTHILLHLFVCELHLLACPPRFLVVLSVLPPSLAGMSGPLTWWRQWASSTVNGLQQCRRLAAQHRRQLTVPAVSSNKP